MDPEAEATIARGLREGRTSAWQALYDAHARGVWRLVARQVGPDAADVADVVQETLLAAARSARQYDPERGSLWMWLCGIARRQAALYLRKRRRGPAVQAGEPSGDGCPGAVQWLDAGELPGDAAARRELAETVRAALGRLTLEYETLLRARYFDGVSVDELAGQGGTTPTAVRSMLARARRAFRDVFLRCQTHDG